MSYLVTTVTGNGYSCSCCSKTYTSTAWFDDRDDAISEVPTSVRLNEDEPDEDADGNCVFDNTSEYDLHEVEVKDGSTGDVIAWGRISSTVHDRNFYGGPQYSRWSGWGRDGPFEVIWGGGRGRVTDVSWECLCAQEKLKLAEARLSSKKREFDQAKKDHDWPEKLCSEARTDLEAQAARDAAKKRLEVASSP
mgnify:CR=1 FL=1